MTPRIGVYVCECGNNISDNVDMEKVLQEASRMPGVVKVLPHRLMCSKEGQDFLVEEIRKEGLTHMVVAACSPRQHMPTFMEVCRTAGMNPYLLQMANIREQCAWVSADKEEATEKAIRLIRAAVRRVTWQSPLLDREVTADPNIVVVGSGRTAVTMARALGGTGRTVHLISSPSSNGSEIARHIEGKISGDHGVVHHEDKVKAIRGFFGNFEIELENEGASTIKVGGIVLASDPVTLGRGSFGYSDTEAPGVLLLQELGDRPGSELISHRKIVMVHCCGRDKVGYCSGICCIQALEAVRRMREECPNAEIIELYQDMCVPGRDGQRRLDETLSTGVKLVWGKPKDVRRQGDESVVHYLDADGKEGRLNADLVVLVPATVPDPDTMALAELVGLDRGAEGFVLPEHEKIAPASSAVNGVYLCGGAVGPIDDETSNISAWAASGKVLAELVPGRTLKLEAKTSQVCEALCTGCRNCMTVCSYSAIDFDPITHTCKVNEALCRGCGNCVAACPSGAIKVKHSTFDQIFQEIREALR